MSLALGAAGSPCWAALQRASVSAAGKEADRGGRAPSTSGDGRYVAFESEATNLVPGDTNGAADVFVKDLATGAVVRASVSASGAQATAESHSPSLSADGRYVAFDSDAPNLVSGDTNGAADVFVKDLFTGAIARASVTASARQSDGASFWPSLSADGRVVAFQSWASNLVTGDTNGAIDILVKDLATGAVRRASLSASGAEVGGDSYHPSLSADGRSVAFESYATDLVPDESGARADVFVKDLSTGALRRASVSASGETGNADSYSPALSGDGRYVAFESAASNLVPADTNLLPDILVKDLLTGAMVRASETALGVEGDGRSGRPSISWDGRVVAFESEAGNLVAGDAGGLSDVFVRDLATGALRRLSILVSGQGGNGPSHSAALSGDGRVVAFVSEAANLTSGDLNGCPDVFTGLTGFGAAASDTTAPTVKVTAPAAGATLAGVVAVTASASDNLGVAGVQFLLDGKPLGIEDTAAPYSVPLDSTTLTAGTHTLAARARDAAGNQATSPAVSVTVPSPPPPPTDSAGTTVTFRQGVGGYTGAQDYVLSTQGATYNGGNGITTDGTRMLLYRGAYETRVLLRFDNLTLPAGAVVQSATLTLNLENPNLGVAVGGYYLKAPWNGTSTETVSWLRRDLEAEWTVPGAGGVGTDRVSGKSFGLVVEGYDKEQRVDLDPGVVQSWVSNPSTNQGVVLVPLTDTKALYVSASDSELVAARPMLSITYTTGTVSADTTPPTVKVTAPSSGATLAGVVAVTASASDNLGVAGVQFLLDGKPLGIEDTAAPYSVPLDSTTLTAGTHTLAARARDAAGNQATSAAVSVTAPSTVPPMRPVTLTFRQGVSGYSGTQDYVLSTQGATYNGGNGLTTDGTRMLLFSKTGSGAYETRVLLRFHKLTLPAGAVVQSATLTLNLENPSLGVAVGGYYLKAPWNGTSTETVSWLRRDLEAEWTVPGAGGSGTDRVLGKSFGLVVESYDKEQRVDLDPGIVQGWANDPSTNQGVELVPLTDDRPLYISSSDHDLLDLRPTLTLECLVP